MKGTIHPRFCAKRAVSSFCWSRTTVFDAGVGSPYRDRPRQEAEARAPHGCARARPEKDCPPLRLHTLKCPYRAHFLTSNKVEALGTHFFNVVFVGVEFRIMVRFCVGAKGVQYLVSGHAVNTSLYALSRLPVSQGPETRYRTPFALCENIGQWFLWVSHDGLRRRIGWFFSGPYIFRMSGTPRAQG